MSLSQIVIAPHTISLSIMGQDNGPTFVLIHGIGVSRRYFAPLAAQLSQHGRVVSFDLPGFGRSSRPNPALDLAQLAEVTHKMVVQLGLSEVSLIGQSMGCQIAAVMLHKYSLAGYKAIFISPTTNDRERTAALQGWRLIQDSFHEPPRLNRLVFADYLRCGPSRYFATLRHMLADRIEDSLSASQAPVLIIRGSKDHIVPASWAKRLADIRPGIQLVEVTSAPHLVQYTHAAEVARLCLDASLNKLYARS